MTGGGHLWLLLATARGDETEHQEGDDRHDQDVEELHALETVTHEHGSEQAAGCDTSQWAEPARSTAGSRCTARDGSSRARCGGCRGRGLTGLVGGGRADALAAAETLGGLGVDAQRQADAQRKGDAKKTLHKGFPIGGLHARHVAQVWGS
ncbi:hypothetical protein D9M72_566370 [compost metagenome]